MIHHVNETWLRRAVKAGREFLVVGIDPGMVAAAWCAGRELSSRGIADHGPVGPDLAHTLTDAVRVYSPETHPNMPVLVCLERCKRYTEIWGDYLVGMLQGIDRARDFFVLRVNPNTWRKEVLGDGRASKQDAIAAAWPLNDHNEAEAACIRQYGQILIMYAKLKGSRT